MKPPNPIFGIPERWEHFANSHALFLERRPRLEEAAKLAFTREDAISAPVDAVVFFIGRLCADGSLKFGAVSNIVVGSRYERDPEHHE